MLLFLYRAWGPVQGVITVTCKGLWPLHYIHVRALRALTLYLVMGCAHY